MNTELVKNNMQVRQEAELLRGPEFVDEKMRKQIQILKQVKRATARYSAEADLHTFKGNLYTGISIANVSRMEKEALVSLGSLRNPPILAGNNLLFCRVHI